MSAKILKQLGIILAICLAAEFIVSLLPIAFPSSVMAILILALLCISLVMTFLGTYASVRIVQICMKRLAGKGGQADE